ncbi:hypothetical protein C8R43DRAFT_908732 [Mycena crocata]|nr:hypothetical protein C8R43DRAFT_908732 [Mycena crocata]
MPQRNWHGSWHPSRSFATIIHILCVPLLICMSFQVLLCAIPVPDFVPSIQYSFSAHLAFEFNFSALHAALYLAYHFILQPTVTALLYTPQMVLSLLSATAYSRSGNITRPAILHAVSWILHFIGHAVAENRTPAPLDTFVMGAVALTPFMTSPDFLYKLGYRPRMYKELDKKR